MSTYAAVRRSRLLLAALLIVRSAAVAAAEPALEIPDDVIFETDIEYSNPDGQRLELDLARPKTRPTSAPAVLCIHGGGFRAGNRQHHDRLCIQLAQPATWRQPSRTGWRRSISFPPPCTM